MNNPHRWLARTIVIGGLCALIAWTLGATATPESKGTWRDGAAVFLWCFAGIALLCLPFVVPPVLRYRKVKRDPNPHARWTVPIDEWRLFVAHERALEKSKVGLLNTLDIGQKAPGSGVDVIMSNGATVVGTEIFYLGSAKSVRRVDSTPPTIEYTIEQVDPDDSRVDRAIRFPIAPNAESEARKMLG